MNTGTILVIDDDREMRVSLNHLLQSAGYDTVIANGGPEAVSYTHLTLPTKA